ncbi:MAG: hypothetical protein ACKPH7_14205 [Planktothrix sp.]|uniref:hypothetical protein n=1 Tax=Planktothrix sp. TaxID=3088171 RepID=UPI0038D502D7
MLNQFNGFNQVLGISLISLSVTTILVTSNHQNFARAQENPGCFIVDHAERVINLDGICNVLGQNKEETKKAQSKNGISVSNLTIERDSTKGFARIRGIIKNESDSSIDVTQLKLQINKNNEPLDIHLVTVGNVLSSGQKYPINDLVSLESLGVKNIKDINITFLNWF